MKNKIITILFIFVIGTFFVLNITVKNKDISYSERRKLTTFSVIKNTSVLDNSFKDTFEKYSLDQFPFRETFRSAKALFNYNVLRKLENNNIFLDGEYIFKSEYPTNYKSIETFTNKINSIKKNILSEDNNVYYAIIPDKNYYLDSNTFLNIDYEYLYNYLSNNLNGIKEINLKDTLDLNNYYKTDTHWKQETLGDVATTLLNCMNVNEIKESYTNKPISNFKGVLYGQSAISNNKDNLIYLISNSILNSKVKYLETPSLNSIYNEEKLNSIDPYDVYLNGAESFIEIYNDNYINDKELVIFRDSFGSSITPLLIASYKKITLIDIRYINYDYYKALINFNDQDVLFLYSTMLVNQSSALK